MSIKNLLAIVLLVSAVISRAAELSIPNLSPSGWTPGTDVGVIGGIAAKVAARTTLHDVTQAPFSVDNDGSAEVNTSINANISTVGTGEVLYFPYGLYRFDSPPFIGSQNITVRGAGPGVLSTSSVQIGTGAKTFTVPAGLGWTSGIGTRVWSALSPHKWMQGTVTSYSGTSLVLDITSTSGDTDTLALWNVGQTVLYRTANVQFFNITGGSVSTVANVTGNHTAGATTITVDSTTGFGSAPIMCKIVQLDKANGEEYHHYPGPTTYNEITNIVTGISGTTLTLDRPLAIDLNSAQSPKIAVGSQGVKDLGYESFAAFGQTGGGGTQVFLSLSGARNSWVYNVQLAIGENYLISLGNSVGCEIANSWVGGTWDGTDANKAPLSMGGTNFMLVRDSVLIGGLTTEGTPDYNNAFLRNFARGYYPTPNHGSGSQYRLFEYNIFSAIHFDGYHGGSKNDTVFRNWFDGSYSGFPYGYIIQNRYNRTNSVVGNVLGASGLTLGGHSMGNPNGGNGDNDGITAEPALYVSSGGMSGSLFIHVDASAASRITGTATFSGGTATVTLNNGYTLEDELSDEKVIGSANFPFHLEWNGNGYDKEFKFNMTIERGSSSGSTIVMTGGSFAGATTFTPATSAFPANGTAVTIRPGEFGQQELDGSVEDTMFIKENYIYGTGGSGGAIDIPTSDTLPESLAESGAPADWPTGAITWPPAISPDSPNIGSSVIPAQFRYYNGYWAEPSAGSGTQATVTGTTTVTGTLTLP